MNGGATSAFPQVLAAKAILITDKKGNELTYLAQMDPSTGFMDPEHITKLGLELQPAHKAALPFPFTCIDNFLPQEVIDRCLKEFPEAPTNLERSYDRAQERYKRDIRPEAMSSGARSLFYAFNSLPFIKIVENITGIRGLIPDPYFFGGGFHEIGTGGHLSVHADFNHHKPMDLERRVNVLIYLNKDWGDECGGQLELWDNAMEKCEHSIVPVANRCVMFDTRSDTYHGNPTPVCHPLGLTRKSIALYYYTATWTGLKRDHTTQFQVRQASSDEFDWKIKRRELIEDYVPPVMVRAIRKLRRA